MDLRSALKEQYHGGLAMLSECVELCPDDLWSAPNSLGEPDEHLVSRSFWRIAFHGAYFTHLYLGQGEDAFQRPGKEIAVGRRDDLECLWQTPLSTEPYELPAETEPCKQTELNDYILFVDGLIDSTVDNLDLDSQNPGFHWYKNINKLSHELMNLRHVQGHVGQLSELLMARGIDTRWMGKASKASDRRR